MSEGVLVTLSVAYVTVGTCLAVSFMRWADKEGEAFDALDFVIVAFTWPSMFIRMMRRGDGD
jgi:hypothetical protein